MKFSDGGKGGGGGEARFIFSVIAKMKIFDTGAGLSFVKPVSGKWPVARSLYTNRQLYEMQCINEIQRLHVNNLH